MLSRCTVHVLEGQAHMAHVTAPDLVSAEILGFMARAVVDLGQTIVMVTHDPVAASYADRVVFLADGCLRGQLDHPTPDTVLDAMRHLGQ